jgi:hypothetical protein
MDGTWACVTADHLSYVCTLSTDLVTAIQDVIEAVWFAAGAVMAGTVVVAVSVVLLRRV